MKLLKKIVFLMIVALCVAQLAIAGGQSEAAVDSDSEAVLTVWKFGGVRIEKAFAVKQVQAWNEAHPDMYVEWVEFDWGSRIEKVVSSHEGGRLPDIIVVDTQSIPDFANMGVIQSITDLDSSYVEKWKTRIVPEIYDLGYYNDKFYGFSTYIDMATFLGYNTDMVRKAVLSTRKATPVLLKPGVKLYLTVKPSKTRE